MPTSRPPSGTRPLLGAVTASVVVGSGSASVQCAPIMSEASAAAEAAALKATASADADDASADAAAASAASDLFERAPPDARLGATRAVLPALMDAHARGGGIFCYLTTRDACAVRATSKELRAAVAAFPWSDISTRVTGPLSLWRKCIPRARAVNLRGRADLCDDDFSSIRGVRVVDISGVAPAGRQYGISDRAFAALAGVRELDMSFCNSPRVTGLALAYVAGVRTINLSYCNQPGIADCHFVHLRGTREIMMGGCTQLTDAAIAHLGAAETLSLNNCTQPGLTGRAFSFARGLVSLTVFGCSPAVVAAAADALAASRAHAV